MHIREMNLTNNEYKNFVTLNKSNHSYVTNNQIIQKFNSNSFRNKRCFIIAGGESLKGFDFNRLNNEITIGINKTFQFYQNSTINYSMDSDFYDALREGRLDKHSNEKLWDKWLSYKGTRIFLTPLEIKKFGDEVYLVRRVIDFKIIRELDDGIYGGTNSATGALMLAIALGCTQIYLLGYDMKVKTQSHWHGGYPDRNLNDFSMKLYEYKTEIEKLCPMISQMGVSVINLNSDSALTCFEFNTIDKVLS